MRRLKKNISAVGMSAVTAILFAYVVTCFLAGGDACAAIMPRQKKGSDTYTVQIGENTLELTESEYICGHLAAALPPEADEEAMKALAVVLRTQLYRLTKEQAAKSRKTAAEEEQPADTQPAMEAEGLIQVEPSAFMEEYMCAKAWGAGRYIRFQEKARRAVNETAEQVLCDENGLLIEAPYHGISAGRTRSAGETYPYLQAADSRSDVEAPQYLTVYWFDTARLSDSFPEISEEEWAQVMTVEETDSYYIKEVRLGEQLVDGEAFRQALSLCSSAYFASWKENGLQVVCRGRGHGFGLSCYGAQQMALGGGDYREILAHYYNDAVLEAK